MRRTSNGAVLCELLLRTWFLQAIEKAQDFISWALGHELAVRSHCVLVSINGSFFFFFFPAPPYGMWDLSSPNQGSNPSLMHWKHGVLTTGPPGKSLGFHYCNTPTSELLRGWIRTVMWMNSDTAYITRAVPGSEQKLRKYSCTPH